jgi:hypothetical protein
MPGRAFPSLPWLSGDGGTMIKLLYKPVSFLISVLGGILARAVFQRVWKFAAGEEEAPGATDIRRGYREVLIAAALEGAIFALVKAALERGAADGIRKLTGYWPGEDSEPGNRKGVRERGGQAR